MAINLITMLLEVRLLALEKLHIAGELSAHFALLAVDVQDAGVKLSGVE